MLRLAAVALLLTTTVAYADATDEYVAKALKTYDVPGLALVVIRDGEVVKAAGYGFADRASGVPVTTSTVFKIGSVSKQLIATGILLLAQDGRLTLDQPASRYLQGTPASWTAITIRHLLSHTAGLVRESPGFEPNKTIADIDVIRSAYGVPLRFEPGTKFEYSNVGYYALAEIISVVSGMPWADFITTRIFTPLDMQATMPTSSQKPPSMAIGYGGRNNVKRADDWVALRPSGAFRSTVLDLAKWEAALTSGRLLRDDTRTQMWTRVPLADASAAPYGYGWHITTFNTRPMVWHGGGLPGFSAYSMRLLDDGLSIYILTNADDVDTGAIAANVASLHLPPQK